MIKDSRKNILASEKETGKKRVDWFQLEKLDYVKLF